MSVLRFITFSLLWVSCTMLSFSQSDSTILKIEDKVFTRGEFDFIYNKNNQVAETKKSANEYLELFVNYKLKVHEAEKEGLDTLVSFKNELAYYKEELIKPYLTDKSVTEELLKEAYSHLENEVNASHILILIPRNPTPADTLKAYNKALEVQKKLNDGGNFEELAVAYSEDPSAANNKGHLGYFSGFMMVYPFEKVAYLTPVGSVSPITRTQFGYHLILIHGIRKSRGEIRVAHIMRVFPRNSAQDVVDKVKLSIDSVYTKLLAGAKFEDMAHQYSEDGNTARKGGELAWFGTGRMIPDFADPAFELKKDGDISQPIKTPFGWHIIKRLELKGIKSYSEMKPDLETRIANDERAYSGQKAVVQRLKKEYEFVENHGNFELLSSLVAKPVINDSLFYTGNTNNENVLFTFAKTNFTVAKFKTYLKESKGYSLQFGYDAFVKNYSEYQEQSILNYEKSILATKYPAYNYLLNEYHDGLLIFEISKREVWDKASADTLGLKQYYAKNTSQFISPEQFVGRVFYCKDKQALTQVKKFKDSPKNILDSVVNEMNSKEQVISYLHGSFAKGDNELVDEAKFKVKNTKALSKPNLPIHLLSGVMKKPTQRTFEEAKGQVISEYQNHLDQIWIKTLREKYKPIVGSL